MGFLVRWFRKALFIGLLICLWSGGWGLWNGLRHASPTAVVLADAEQDTPDHVTLQNIALDLPGGVLITKLKTQRTLYIPIRPKGSGPNTKIRFLLKSTDPKLLDAVDSKTPAASDGARLANVLPFLAKLAAQSDVTGMIASEFDTPTAEERKIREGMPMLAREFKVLVEGEKPSWGRGLLLLGGAVGLFFLIGVTAPAPASQPPPVAPPVAVPPKV
jgi:hypothetical protein